MHVGRPDTETNPCPVVTTRKLYRLATTASSGRLSAIVVTIGFAFATFVHSDPHSYNAAPHKVLRAEGPVDFLRVCHGQVTPHFSHKRRPSNSRTLDMLRRSDATKRVGPM